MDTKRSKLRSLIKQVQSSTEEILTRRPSIPTSPGASHFPTASSSFSSSGNTQNDHQLDLSSAIEYNHYLINSYLEERNARELPLYQAIIAEANPSDKQSVAQCEQQIIDEIRKEFFLQSNLEEDDENDEDDSDSDISKNPEELNNTENIADNLECVSENIETCDSNTKPELDSTIQSINTNNLEPELVSSTDRSEQPDVIKTISSSPLPHRHLTQSKILELCVLSNLPDFSTTSSSEGISDDKNELSSLKSSMKCDTFLRYLNEEKERLTKQVTIVSKRLSDMIVDNEDHFGTELKRVNQIDQNLKNAIGICGNGRNSLFLSRRDFTSSSLSIVENYSRREAIVGVIKSLQNIQTIQSTIEHIKSLLELDKNFPSAIRLYHETSETLEQMASSYSCVKEMKSKLVEMLLLAEEQMDHALAKMPTNFCPQTYQQLANAYKQIDKSDSSIHQLMMHFTNTIHDKAFCIVLGYVELFADLGTVNSSTPIKARKGRMDGSTLPESVSSSDLKRKPFTELCQYLKAESFLSCLTDLCRAMWDVMQNYFRVLCFYKSRERLKSSGLAEEDVQFAVTKLEHGVLQVWSDIQHKIRTLVSSVKFVELNLKNDDGCSQAQSDSQDQLLFTFEEFIKILTVCEKMIEIGEEFCSLYRSGSEDRSGTVTIELQNMLYQQTRAYFQSYHQVSMAELRIFLENETWTRCPVETLDEFSLIASLQEFSFIKNRLLKMRLSQVKNLSSTENLVSSTNNKPTRPLAHTSPKSSTSSSFLLSPLTKSKDYFAAYFIDCDEDCIVDDDEEDSDESSSKGSPFDDILSLAINQSIYPDDPEVVDDVIADSADGLIQGPEIATTNTALNVVRLTGRYMHIMYLLRPISHDVIKALMELFDYYFFTVYRFFAVDALNTSWLSTCILSVVQASNLSIDPVPVPITPISQSSSTNHFSQISNELRSFIRRINDTLILNESNNISHNNTSLVASQSMSSVHNVSLNHDPSPNAQSTPNTSPKRLVKYPPPMLPDYVPINQSTSLYALPERIMAIESLIFIARQFYNLCPFLLDILRNEEQSHQQTQQQQQQENAVDNSAKRQSQQQTEDGFKLLQFYHDEMCLSVESLIYQCLFAVSTKLMSYESIIVGMGATKWDLKEIPSIHSRYVDQFVHEIKTFNDRYVELLAMYDLAFMTPPASVSTTVSKVPNGISTETAIDEALSTPLNKLELLSQRINPLLWECIVRISNRCFVEGFASAKKCTNEGRALMQLDYQQYLINMEKLITPYFVTLDKSESNNCARQAKALLAAEKEFVEEYVKAYYLTEAIFLDWIRQRHEYTTKQVVSLVNCIAGDNRKLKSSLLAAIDTTNNGETNNNMSTLSIN